MCARRLAVALPLCLASSAPLPAVLRGHLPLQIAGLGRYGPSPALFLHKKLGSSEVLPVPVPLDAVKALEMALSGKERQSMVEILLQCRAIVNRDDGIFDGLPWDWASSSLSKRDAFARFQGRAFPREGYASPYHLLLDACRREACADVSHVIIENTDALGALCLGGAVLVERRLCTQGADASAAPMGAGPPAATDQRWWGGAAAEPRLCECTIDEALGIAVALGGEVYVDEAVWNVAKTTPAYFLQRGKVRIDVQPAANPEVETQLVERSRSAAPLPWEIRSAEQLQSMTTEQLARVALAAGLRLPRARQLSDESLTEMLEPLMDEAVRRDMRVARAADEGDFAAAAALQAGASCRGQLLGRLRQAVAEERYLAAAELAAELAIETSRRADVTQDEGAYSRFLDQDDWYAAQLAREREKLLDDEREKLQRLEAVEAAEKMEISTRSQGKAPPPFGSKEVDAPPPDMGLG
mmetsp:Transcript_48219/g.111643  ORF Transcript_48219/g.111643 Transcript_48219/m.111643 type:complete len:470 (-) Transcript_48219:50-1459(-)